MRAALTLLATTHNISVIAVDDIDWETTESLRKMAKSMRCAEQDVERLKEYHRLMIEAAKADDVAKANLNYEEHRKLETKGCRSKQRRKW